jgi:hypothetical protein
MLLDRVLRSAGRNVVDVYRHRRSAAWVLERADPNSLSLRPQKKPDAWKSLGKRRFKQLIAEALQELLPKSLEAHARKPVIDTSRQRINDRLAEIETQCAPY